jgi:Na+/H+ antiporter NhaD/arsenite permease-like protein
MIRWLKNSQRVLGGGLVMLVVLASMAMVPPAWGESPGHVDGEAAVLPTGEVGMHYDHAALGRGLPLWTIAPFAVLLLCIAILPLTTPHWWEHNRNKGYVACGLAALIALYLAIAWQDAGIGALQHVLMEYATFIVLLGSLYVISGGIYVSGSLNGTPIANTSLLALGAVIASIIGTTGASVLLIRPLLRANRTRMNKVHIVVMFIFIVSNCGGLLTPLGDPPLFMGFTAGVPFSWTLVNLWPQWLMVNLALLVIFHIWESVVFDREEKQRPGSQLEEVMKHEPLGIRGGLNFLFLAGIVGAVLGKGYFREQWPWGVQEGIMLGVTALAYFTTAPVNRENNKFTFAPIVEVAVLFVGIFITMTPALQILNAWGSGDRPDLGELAIREPWQFFWISGVLSSFLDNAPTYITMAATASGLKGIEAEGLYLAEFLQQDGANILLRAISCGAVFMGANTYIGNGPNFMVKAIAEENGVRMPSFFGYMAYSVGILIPIFIAVTFVFFR